MADCEREGRPRCTIKSIAWAIGMRTTPFRPIDPGVAIQHLVLFGAEGFEIQHGLLLKLGLREDLARLNGGRHVGLFLRLEELEKPEQQQDRDQADGDHGDAELADRPDIDVGGLVAGTVVWSVS